MSILRIVITDLYEFDGIGNFVRYVADRVKKNNVPVAFYAERHSPSISVDGDYSDLFRQVQPGDVVFCQLSHLDPCFPQLMALPCRKVVYYHNITPGRFFKDFDPDTAYTLDVSRASLGLLAGADAVIANSDWSLSDTLEFLRPDAKYGSMPPLTDEMLSRLKRDFAEPPFLPPQSYLLTVGRLVPHKNQTWGLRLFSLIHKLLPELSYVIVGGGFEAYLEKLRNLADSFGEASKRIYFTGQISESKHASLFNNAAALVNCSLHEGFCSPLLEAMACDVPILSLPQPAVRQTLGDGGIVLDEGDLTLSAEKAIALLTDPLLKAKVIEKQKYQLHKLRTKIQESILWNLLDPKIPIS
jgi:glycosyltransferase involved in cell wall biosynthesis